jgi:hypothetical protein
MLDGRPLGGLFMSVLVWSVLPSLSLSTVLAQNSSRTQPVYSIYACPFILNTFGGITLLGGKPSPTLPRASRMSASEVSAGGRPWSLRYPWTTLTTALLRVLASMHVAPSVPLFTL